MRIIAGTARGRPLLGPKDDGIRPTSDRVRETVFNVLGQWMDGLTVLDLYAGTGALAFEALSRGAASAVLVDSSREAVRLIRANAQALGFEKQIEVLASPVARALDRLEGDGRKFELVFADPPYAARAVGELLGRVGAVLAPGGRFVVEHDRREEAPDFSGGLARADQRRFGDTMVSFYVAHGASARDA